MVFSWFTHDGVPIMTTFSATAPLTATCREFAFRGATMHGMNEVILNSGLAVDYDGSQSNFQSSMNYSMHEYARDVVDGVGEICHEAGVKDPILVTEAGEVKLKMAKLRGQPSFETGMVERDLWRRCCRRRDGLSADHGCPMASSDLV